MLVKTCPGNENVYDELTILPPQEEYKNIYDEWIIVQPPEEKVREATTYITHVLVTGKLKDQSEEVQYDSYLNISRRAISYINSYDDKTKKLITDMQTFIQTLLNSPKYKNSPKSKLVEAAENVFISDRDITPRSAPIKIQNQTFQDERTSFGSPTSQSDGIFTFSCSPPPLICSQACGSPKQQNPGYQLFMKPAFSWNAETTSIQKGTPTAVELK